MFKKAKKIWKDHKKEVVIGGLIVVGGICVTVLCRKKIPRPAYVLADCRDAEAMTACVAKFFVEGTDECLGSFSCTKGFVEDMLNLLPPGKAIQAAFRKAEV